MNTSSLEKYKSIHGCYQQTDWHPPWMLQLQPALRQIWTEISLLAISMSGGFYRGLFVRPKWCLSLLILGLIGAFSSLLKEKRARLTELGVQLVLKCDKDLDCIYCLEHQGVYLFAVWPSEDMHKTLDSPALTTMWPSNCCQSFVHITQT